MVLRHDDPPLSSAFRPPEQRPETAPGRPVSYQAGAGRTSRNLPTRRRGRSSGTIDPVFWTALVTKLRPPLSIEQALCDVIDVIGMDRAAKVTNRSHFYLRRLSDPDRRAKLTCEDALLLDAEHDATVGGRPIHDVMKAKLDAQRAHITFDQQALLAATIECVRENGDATAALIAATADPSPTTLRAALRGLVQSVQAKNRITTILRQMIRRQPQAP